MTKTEFKALVKKSVSKSELCRSLGFFNNGSGMRTVNKLIQEYGVDISHFSHKAAMNKFQRKYPIVEKMCPVCKVKFTTQEGSPGEKTTCSHSCSNTLFRSGKNNPNYVSDKNEWGYRKRCFDNREKKCILCGFHEIVEVHHLDGNHHNNDASNLIPLCPNHHKMYHTKKHKQQIINAIQNVI